MQQREDAPVLRSPLEALLARTDDAALDYVTDRLLGGDPLAARRGARRQAAAVEREELAVEG